MTPLMKQYYKIKEEHPNSVLFFRMGDFYELFGNDAVLSAGILGITLTKRNNGKAGEIPLCGFPHHAAERYVPKMVKAGHRVAICEQVEDPKTAKGLVKREVVEIITAGTSLSENVLDAKSSNFLVSVFGNATLDTFALASLEISTGDFSVCIGSAEEIECELYRIRPSEVLYESSQSIPFLETFCLFEKTPATPLLIDFFEAEKSFETLCKQFKVDNLDSFGLNNLQGLIGAPGSVLLYALDQKKTSLDHLDRVRFKQLKNYMTLDPQTLRNLELLKPLNAEDDNSTLVHILDKTITAMGARKLKEWVAHPLLIKNEINERLDALDEILNNPILQADLKNELREIHDLERLMGRVGSGRANGRDLLALGKSLVKAAAVGELLADTKCPFLKQSGISGEDLLEKGHYILGYITEEPPLTLREGRIIRPGCSPKLDALNEGIREAREWLSGLEGRERERTGISSLKIGFNKVFGYYLEVPSSHHDKVPEEYIRKQTLANAERFISPEMKEYETQILNAEGGINQLEYKVFCELRDHVNTWCPSLRDVAGKIAQIDCIYSLAKATIKYGFIRPELNEEKSLSIQDGFHPVIVSLNPQIEFIKNDTQIDWENLKIKLITGPNMAGKSTYLRQTGLIVLMAQMGCFVPAQKATIGIVDRIFTRVGASDRLARGQSTFMVEMVETANILHNASDRSLILLDEIGRGTSTFDGLSLAWSIVEHIQKNIHAKTLFATHYHELTVLAEELQDVKNYHITVKEEQGSLLFLRKIISGACDSSYGIQVAEMAGLPKEVVVRAKGILKDLEGTPIHHSVSNTPTKIEKPQGDLFGGPSISTNEQLALEELQRADPNSLSPMDALQLLFDLKKHYLNK
jgi:DNA mismatch repair protein MutS